MKHLLRGLIIKMMNMKYCIKRVGNISEMNEFFTKLNDRKYFSINSSFEDEYYYYHYPLCNNKCIFLGKQKGYKEISFEDFKRVYNQKEIIEYEIY